MELHAAPSLKVRRSRLAVSLELRRRAAAARRRTSLSVHHDCWLQDCRRAKRHLEIGRLAERESDHRRIRQKRTAGDLEYRRRRRSPTKRERSPCRRAADRWCRAVSEPGAMNSIELSSGILSAGSDRRGVYIEAGRLEPDDPAVYAMTDFRRECPICVPPSRSIDEALEDMNRLGIHALLVTEPQDSTSHDQMLGLITSYRIQQGAALGGSRDR